MIYFIYIIHNKTIAFRGGLQAEKQDRNSSIKRKLNVLIKLHKKIEFSDPHFLFDQWLLSIKHFDQYLTSFQIGVTLNDTHSHSEA